jgi:hypothetical protein
MGSVAGCSCSRSCGGSGELNRQDFGITTNIPMDGGGVVIGDRIHVILEVEAILTSSPAADTDAVGRRGGDHAGRADELNFALVANKRSVS